MRRPALTPRQAALALDGFTLAVIASVGIALAGLTWRIVGWAGGDAPAAPAPRPAVALPQAGGAADVAPILAFAPFGTPAGGDAAATTLPIELKGIMLAVPAERSVALIAPAGGGQPSIAYAAGATVPGGGTVEAIAIDHVLLAVGGRRERLSFPRPGAPAATAPSTPPPAAAASLAPPPGAPPPAGPPPAAAALTASPQALLDSLGATPVAGGYQVGPALSPPMRAAGLRAGDVIQSLNGQPLGNGAADQQLLAAAARSGTATVQVQRGDSRLTLAFPFR